MRNNYRDENWINTKFGKLTVLAINPVNGEGTYWRCKCDCGNEITSKAQRIFSKHVVSCGCSYSNRRHGLSLDSTGKINRLYSVWTSMRSRCNNPNDSAYINYGGRGIRVCDEWEHYPTFHSWAMSSGYDPSARRGYCTLDRIDVDGPYSPENCQWATPYIQAKNKRPICNKTPHYTITEDGLKTLIDIAQMRLDGHTYKEIGDKYGLSKQAIQQMLSLRLQKAKPL